MWISTKMSTPNVEKVDEYFYISKEILITDGKRISIGRFVIDETVKNDIFRGFEGGIYTDSITHWMRIPLLPDGGESE